MFYSSDFMVIGMSMLALAGFIWYAVMIVVRQAGPGAGPTPGRRSGSVREKER